MGNGTLENGMGKIEIPTPVINKEYMLKPNSRLSNLYSDSKLVTLVVGLASGAAQIALNISPAAHSMMTSQRTELITSSGDTKTTNLGYYPSKQIVCGKVLKLKDKNICPPLF